MNVSGNVVVDIALEVTKALDLTTARADVALKELLRLTIGTGDDQADIVWHDRGTLVDEASVEIDLATGLTDSFGDPVDMQELRMLFIRNRTAGEILLIGAATGTPLSIFGDSAADFLKLYRGVFLYTARDDGDVVIGANGKLKLEHGSVQSEDLEYDIVVIGTTA